MVIREACVETFEEARLAERRGADRVELCSQLSVGGLTPGLELAKRVCSSLAIPVMAMIRPRAGDFVCSRVEIDLMKRQIDDLREAGACGVVFGALTTDRQIDVATTRELVAHARPLAVTFHKAVDEDDPVDSLRVLRAITGIDRVLTSGGKPTAAEGAETLRAMIGLAGANPIILVAGKVTDTNIAAVESLTGASEFHGRRIVGSLER